MPHPLLQPTSAWLDSTTMCCCPAMANHAASSMPAFMHLVSSNACMSTPDVSMLSLHIAWRCTDCVLSQADCHLLHCRSWSCQILGRCRRVSSGTGGLSTLSRMLCPPCACTTACRSCSGTGVLCDLGSCTLFTIQSSRQLPGKLTQLGVLQTQFQTPAPACFCSSSQSCTQFAWPPICCTASIFQAVTIQPLHPSSPK